ncbi:MAG: transcriptional repressor [Blautia sp.]|uniref:Fur family transcriptional regulator n=1 Tax=Blautia sp. TaxID=1955243 RepID=UPI002E7A2AEC|nr:transcriptional repressor [Blautia sp.]MEE1444371.1 transcriptional repressor [Blautia sp.]
MATLKYSRQREYIREYVRSCKEHPTADSIYGKMKEEFPNISLGTVYRNLSLLVELGEITKISVDNGPERFDCNTKPHSHFVCTYCHCIQDMDLPEIDGLVKKASKDFCGKISSHRTTFYGICKHCLEEQKLLKST